MKHLTAVRRILLYSLLAALTVNACTSSKHSKVSSEPAVGTAPYWCQLFSREGVERITGIPSETMSETWELNKVYGGYGRCAAGSPKHLLVLDMDLNYGSAAQEDSYETLTQKANRGATTRLPTTLGTGYVNNLGDNEFSVYSLFRCGTTPYWIGATITREPSSRNIVTDGTALMTFAQKRLGEIRKCRVNNTAPLPTPIKN